MMLKKRTFMIIIILLMTLLYLNASQLPTINNNDYLTISKHQRLCNLSFAWYPFFISSSGLLVHSTWGFNLYLIPQYIESDDNSDNDHNYIIDILNGKSASNQPQHEAIKYIGYDVYVKYGNAQNEIVRSIDVFDNIKEFRPFYFKITPNSMFFQNSLHFLKLRDNEGQEYLNYLQNFNNLKINQELISPKPNFKIFQISDLHYLNGKIDLKTEIFIINSINAENPNLIIINGDIFNFQKFSKNDFYSMILNSVNLFISLKIPYLINFGDSDYLADDIMTKHMLMFLSNLPYCLNSFQESDVHGLTNYDFLIKHINNPIGVISVLDTFQNKLINSQINKLYRFNSNTNLPSSADANISHKLFKLAFIHYPLPNFRPSGKFKIVGNYNEKGTLDTTTDVSLINDFINIGYNVISASHEHTNDGCILHEKLSTAKDKENKSNNNKNKEEIWLCYSSITGFDTVNNVEVDRKLRVFEIIDNRLLSWKISEKSAKGFDYQLIAEH